MQMTSEQLKAFREDFKLATAALEAKYGVNIKLGNISYSDTSFTSKLTVSNSDSNLEQEEFSRYCYRYGYTPDDYGKVVYTTRGTQYQLVGFSPRAKYKGIGIGVDGKKYRIDLDALVGNSETEVSQTQHTPTGNVCKYCGKKKRSQDPDRLCLKCAETFGHKYYSEL